MDSQTLLNIVFILWFIKFVSNFVFSITGLTKTKVQGGIITYIIYYSTSLGMVLTGGIIIYFLLFDAVFLIQKATVLFGLR